ncbi:hypothetical protein CBS63078_1716 [Aspergillus niger]|nr:hypothetical protein CBS12448_306 [Aspergillus niger]KAI2898980.1 hypothetical protein CBS13152_2691 [Aspergillus niger]KAI2929270.1 hypothetical protein CBS63078_1716 [Aspergillus niger]KAI2976565.1 hypothetical protein CBS147323_598 [Aspergillus niger]KAI2976898.1 hypothetical protein CBS147324_2316 [Aspergillus niger]
MTQQVVSSGCCYSEREASQPQGTDLIQRGIPLHSPQTGFPIIPAPSSSVLLSLLITFSPHHGRRPLQLEGASSSSSSPLILYKPPTIWSILRGAAINLVLPFVNGLMLGFGELFAHEAAYRLGWSGTKVFPMHRRSRPVGPGIEVRDIPSQRRGTRAAGLKDATSLE